MVESIFSSEIAIYIDRAIQLCYTKRQLERAMNMQLSHY